jgi:hypothetical protein
VIPVENYPTRRYCISYLTKHKSMFAKHVRSMSTVLSTLLSPLNHVSLRTLKYNTPFSITVRFKINHSIFVTKGTSFSWTATSPLPYIWILCRLIWNASHIQIICSFHDAVSISDYLPSNGKIISEWWIGKDMEGSGRGLIEIVSRHFSGTGDSDVETLVISLIGDQGASRTDQLANTSLAVAPTCSLRPL